MRNCYFKPLFLPRHSSPHYWTVSKFCVQNLSKRRSFHGAIYGHLSVLIPESKSLKWQKSCHQGNHGKIGFINGRQEHTTSDHLSRRRNDKRKVHHKIQKRSLCQPSSNLAKGHQVQKYFLVTINRCCWWLSSLLCCWLHPFLICWKNRTPNLRS